MPTIDAVVFCKWNRNGAGKIKPDALYDVLAWALANEEYLPGTACGGTWEDLVGRVDNHQRILDNLAVFCARLEVTVPTAQHFANDPRFWTLGYWRRDWQRFL